LRLPWWRRRFPPRWLRAEQVERALRLVPAVLARVRALVPVRAARVQAAQVRAPRARVRAARAPVPLVEARLG
jgi:hypothetical protein